MRRNRSQTAKRRSHHALVAARATKCECGALRRQHRACAQCGRYNGKSVIDVAARAARDARRAKRHEKALRASGHDVKKEEEKTA
jgi:ribosomal protein L32